MVDARQRKSGLMTTLEPDIGLPTSGLLTDRQICTPESVLSTLALPFKSPLDFGGIESNVFGGFFSKFEDRNT